MRLEAQPNISCDRRILKAFYTQYVAVLLIILVFTVGAFQRASQRAPVSVPPSTMTKEAPPIGGMEIAQQFNDLGELGPETAELEAIALVLREHDVKASISIPASMRKIDAPLITVEQALARLASLERFFDQRGVSQESFDLVLGGPAAREGKLVVTFNGEDHDNIPL